MHENTFQELLNSLNKGDIQKLTFSRPLTAEVELANHWTADTHSKTNLFGPDTIYLIKSQVDGPFAGLILEAGQYDLHWYVLPEYRGKGYLSAALKSVVLPHLFQDNREVQNITIDRNMLSEENFEASSRLAKAVGFTYSHEVSGVMHFKMERGIFDETEYIDGDLSPLTDLRAEEIRKQIKFHFKSLEVLQSELEMKLGTTDRVLGIKEELHRMQCDFDSIVADAYMDEQILYSK